MASATLEPVRGSDGVAAAGTGALLLEAWADGVEASGGSTLGWPVAAAAIRWPQPATRSR